ncbi:Gfo/Idh/MocA family oxidoreductase [Streptomyces anulatus]|uniref:Gfo/Idh/MocA family protein n=1 Tax=Streptomyces anulatus TaxID=1892 RepID=UPI0033C8EDBE
MTHAHDQIPLVAVGCGRIFEMAHVPALRESTDFKVTGLVDPSDERLALMKAEFPGAVRATRHLADLDVEGAVVLIAMPSTMRLEVAAAALKAGAAGLFVEKPLGHDARTARRMCDLATSHRRPLLPVHNHLHEESFAQAVAMAGGGALGRISGIRLVHHMTEPFHGVWFEAPDWRIRSVMGCVDDLGYHGLYLAREIAGCPAEPVAQPFVSLGRSGTVDEARIELGHHNGVRTTIEVSWTADRPLHELTITGAEGRVTARNDGTLVSSVRGHEQTYSLEAGLGPMYTKWYRYAADRLRQGTCDESLRVACEVSRTLDHLHGISRPAQEEQTHG